MYKSWRPSNPEPSFIGSVTKLFGGRPAWIAARTYRFIRDSQAEQTGGILGKNEPHLHMGPPTRSDCVGNARRSPV